MAGVNTTADDDHQLQPDTLVAVARGSMVLAYSEL
jgi:hypoxanthine phosphoribosyltransferase